MRSIHKRLLDRVANALQRRGFGDQPRDPLDRYGAEAPGAQLAVDIFKGAWSSEFPPHLGIHAGTSRLFDDSRLQALIDLAGGVRGRRVLELGPLEAAHSYMLEHAGAESVVAIEACVLSYLKCLIVKEITGLRRVSFQFGDFMRFLSASQTRFDLVVASGVLYHQRDPLKCVQQIARCTDVAFIWTHCYQDGLEAERMKARYFTRVPGAQAGGFGCDLYRLEYDTYLPNMKYRGGLDDHAHWMKKDDLLACLRHFGMSDVTIVSEQIDHPFGPNLTLLARRPRERR